MTQTQARQLTRAEAIAERDALTVVTGSLRGDGSPVYGVRSRTDGHYYLLTVEGGRIHCQCAASQHGHICAHAAAVRAHIKLERQELAARDFDPAWVIEPDRTAEKAQRAELDRLAAHALSVDEGYSEWAAWLETRGY